MGNVKGVSDGNRSRKEMDALFCAIVTPLKPPFKEPVWDFDFDNGMTLHLSKEDTDEVHRALALCGSGKKHLVTIYPGTDKDEGKIMIEFKQR